MMIITIVAEQYIYLRGACRWDRYGMCRINRVGNIPDSTNSGDGIYGMMKAGPGNMGGMPGVSVCFSWYRYLYECWLSICNACLENSSGHMIWRVVWNHFFVLIQVDRNHSSISILLPWSMTGGSLGCPQYYQTLDITPLLS